MVNETIKYNNLIFKLKKSKIWYLFIQKYIFFNLTLKKIFPSFNYFLVTNNSFFWILLKNNLSYNIIKLIKLKNYNFSRKSTINLFSFDSKKFHNTHFSNKSDSIININQFQDSFGFLNKIYRKIINLTIIMKNLSNCLYKNLNIILKINNYVEKMNKIF